MTAARWRQVGLALAPPALVLTMSVGTMPSPGGADGPWPWVVLLAQVLPLLLLRWVPRAVLALVVLITCAQILAGMQMTNGLVSQAVAVGFVVATTRWPISVAVPVGVLVLDVAAAAVVGMPGLLRFSAIVASSLLVGWLLGDAVARRAAVSGAMEHELVLRGRRHQLSTRVVAMSERLRISRELHDVVGEALDAVIVQAGAARAVLGRPECAGQIHGIEAVGRAALAELDRFLGLLRRELPDQSGEPGEPPELVGVPSSQRIPWLEERADAVTLVGTAIAVTGLTWIDVSTTPPFTEVAWWPMLFSAAVGAALLLRRRLPEVMLGFLTLLITAHLLAGVPVYNGLVALPVAAHATIAGRDRRRGLVAAGGALVVVVAAAAAGTPSSAVQVAGVALMLTAVALYAGDTARVAREHNETLLHRIAEAEAEGRLRARAALVEERTRVARDLHDSLGHTLSLIVVKAGAARLVLEAQDPAAQDRAATILDGVQGASRVALAGLDDTVNALSEQAPQEGPVLPSCGDLHLLLDGLRSAGSTVTLSGDDLADLPRSLQAAVYRVVQEALTNVMKHAGGAATTVGVCREEEALTVTVRNAAGAEPPPGLPSGGRGLTGMRERAALFGGDVTAGPDPDGGYVVRACVRLPHPRAGAGDPAHTTGVAS